MYKGFNDVLFMAYLQNQYPTVFSGEGSSFTREWAENIIAYAHRYEQVSKDQFCYFISDMMPEIEMGEVAMFMDDDCLTSSGKAMKMCAMEQHHVVIQGRDGAYSMLIDGEMIA